MLESLFTLFEYTVTTKSNTILTIFWTNYSLLIGYLTYTSLHYYGTFKLLVITSLFNYSTIPFNTMLVFFIKFIIAVSFLIFIRTGIPRYRYDYLTKLGWLKFLIYSLVLMVWVLTFFFIF